MADGHLNKCKDCAKNDSTNNRNSNLEQVREYDCRRSKTTIVKDRIRNNTVKWRQDYPDRYRAQTAVGNALRDGKLVKEPCKRCGAIKVHGHHEDYTKPLDVTWLCAVHHKERHKELGDDDFVLSDY
jgi:hypothetical protein